MKVIYALATGLLSLTLAQAQTSNVPPRAPDEAYTRQLVSLLTGLQKNPWLGWETGTEVTVRYFSDSHPPGTPPAPAQPDLVYKVIEADNRFIQTYVFKGKAGRRDFLIKDQPGLDTPSTRIGDTSTTADLEIDGFALSCLLYEFRLEEFPRATWITTEWIWASHPTILLRKELNGFGWRITSARVIKKIGEREFPCVEIKKGMRFYSQGQNHLITTQYLSPEVPGHFVEQIEEYYKMKKEQRSLAPYLVVHQKVVEIKLQKGTR